MRLAKMENRNPQGQNSLMQGPGDGKESCVATFSEKKELLVRLTACSIFSSPEPKAHR